VWRHLALVAVAVLAGPASAEAARRADPLVDRAPQGTRFSDRVTSLPLTIDRAERGARAAQLDTVQYPTAEGYTVDVRFSPSYGVQDQVGRTYVDFLQSLLHGPELDRLQLYVAPLGEVGQVCGGGEEILACYSSATQRMVVPGEELTIAGVTTSYVMTHEYGHHLAANRSNAPLPALDYGPKLWSSRELICARSLEERLAPGDEGEAYRYNPGENWAEVYARLKYPEQPWTFAPLLRPDGAALDAARADVLTPWTGPATQTFQGSVTRGSSRSFGLDLRLDGSLRARVVGAAGSDVQLAIRANGRRQGVTRPTGRSHTLAFDLACRDQQVEPVRFTVRHRGGSAGPFRLTVTYAG